MTLHANRPKSLYECLIQSGFSSQHKGTDLGVQRSHRIKDHECPAANNGKVENWLQILNMKNDHEDLSPGHSFSTKSYNMAQAMCVAILKQKYPVPTKLAISPKTKKLKSSNKIENPRSRSAKSWCVRVSYKAKLSTKFYANQMKTLTAIALTDM